MSDKFVIRGFWGPRKEDAVALANRLHRFLKKVDEACLGVPDGWELPEGGHLISEDDAEVLAGYLQRRIDQNVNRDRELGLVQTASAVSREDVNLEISMVIGLASGIAALHNSVIVRVSSISEPVYGEWLSRAMKILAAIGEEWDPDWGEVSTYRLRKAIRDRIDRQERTPQAGYGIYLSSGRWRQIPDMGSAVQSNFLSNGGLLVSFRVEDGLPSESQVLGLHRALSHAGALAPMPTDAPHFQGKL